MNLIPAIGPFDFKVFGSQKAFVNKPIEFIIKNDDTKIQEILIINPNGSFSSCDIFGKQLDGHLSLEFFPEDIGLHEIRIFTDKTNRLLFNSFEFNVFDSSKMKINFTENTNSGDITTIVGKLFKFTAECLDDRDGNLNVVIEQQDRKLKSIIKQIVNNEDQNKTNLYEITFTPEIEGFCRVDLEFQDYLETTLYGDSFRMNVKASDFLVVPFPLPPYSIDSRGYFSVKFLRENINNFKISIKPSSSNDQSSLSDEIECEYEKREDSSYQVFFTPKTIERHYVEIYFNNELINKDRPIKIDVFDVSKIRAKMPSTIVFGEMNTFIVDTTGAGEGNLEVIIKDGYDTLKAQLLKREKRKFEIGFLCERNMKHDVQVIFNGIQIKDSPFYIHPEVLSCRSVEMLSEIASDDYMVIEGGPLDGLQCGEKMWIIFDAQSAPYFDAQFLVVDDNNFPIKHTKIQQEDGRWRIEFIPINVGVHQIQRILQIDNRAKIQLLQKVNVLHYSAQRIVYGYKLYNIEDSVQLVFDAANFRVQDIIPEVKDPNDELVDDLDCKYLSDYLALKFTPELTGGYLIHFHDRNNYQQIASSPYKVIVHEDYKEIIRSSGIYDLTRLTIAANNLPSNYELNQFNIVVFDTQNNKIQNCFFSNKKNDLIIEFITRTEGVHKIYLYINGELVDDNPFYIYVNGDTYTSNSVSSIFPSPFPNFKTSMNNIANYRYNSSSSNDFGTSFSGQSLISNSDSQIISNNYCQAAVGHGAILCCKRNTQFHFVINDKNIQGLCVYDPLNESVPFKLGEDDHENGSIIIVPKLEGTHKIVGLIEGRDFEAQLFVLNEPGYESQFDMNNYSEEENLMEKPFIISLKKTISKSTWERVDVRYTGDNIATFVPRTTGYFRIYISDYHGPILGSPFYALIHAHKDPPEYCCVESSGIRDTIRNEEAKFIIRNKDLEIDVQIKNPENMNLSLRKKRTNQGYLQVFYTPDMIGPHEIHIFKDGIKVLGSPIVVYVFDPNQVKIENLKREGKIRKSFSFNIDAQKAGEGFIRVNVKDSKMNDILPDITEYDDRKYVVKLTPEILGFYEFSLTFNKYHVIESPFKVLVSSEDDDISIANAANINNNCSNNIIGPSSSATASTSNNISSSLIKQQQHEPILPISSDIIKEEPEDIDLDSSQEADIDNNLNQLNNQSQDSSPFNDIPSLEYELSNWNIHLNNTLNKIMESSSLNATQPTNKRALTPITDTSEEESNDIEGTTYRGETYIENVERLPDGSSHLLLRIDDDNELIDTKNPNRTRGKYKYRFKRVGLSGDWLPNQQNLKTNQLNDDQDDNMSSPAESASMDDSEPELAQLADKSKQLVNKAVDNAIKILKNDIQSTLDESTSEQSDSNESKESPKSIGDRSDGSVHKNVSEKRKLFENAAAAVGAASTSVPANDLVNKSEDIPRPGKVSDLIKQINSAAASNKPSVSSVPLPNKNEKDQEPEQEPESYETARFQDVDDDSDDDDDSFYNNDDNIINVANENLITKLTKEKQKKINQEKTVVIEESYVIRPRKSTDDELKSKVLSPIAASDDNDEDSEPEDSNLLEKEEKTKTQIENVTKIVNEKSGTDKPVHKEEFTQRQVIEPTFASSESVKELGDEKLIEKFKPEETIQYEYEQVIEQPDHSRDESDPDTSTLSDKNNLKIEKTSKKTTKHETKEKFEKVESVSPESVKTITTDMTTYITEEEEDKITEILENTKEVQEFSYAQLKNKQGSSKELNTNLSDMVESLRPNIVDEDSDNDLTTVTVNISASATREFDFLNEPLASSRNSSSMSRNNPIKSSPSFSNTPRSDSFTKSLNKSGSNENILDFYKLQPGSSNESNKIKDLDDNMDDDDEDDEEDVMKKYSEIIKPVDLNSLQHGEQFKPHESTSFDDSYSKSLTIKKNSSDIIKSKEEDYEEEDSLAEIEENLDKTQPIELKSNENPELKKSSSPTESSYFKPIETMTAEDFFNASQTSGEDSESQGPSQEILAPSTPISAPNLKQINLIRAKFEGNNNEPNDSATTSGTTIGKLPRSKVEIYNQEKKSDDLDPKKKLNLSRKSSNESNDEDLSKLPKTRIVSKIPRDSSVNSNQEEYPENVKDESFKKIEEDENLKKRPIGRRIRQPQIYPIDDDNDDYFFSRSKSKSDSDRKSSLEDEDNIYKRPEKPSKAEKSEEPTVAKTEPTVSTSVSPSVVENNSNNNSNKSIKSLVNRYERRNTDTINSDQVAPRDASRENSEQNENQPRPVKKLPSNIVKLFEKEAEPSSSVASGPLSSKFSKPLDSESKPSKPTVASTPLSRNESADRKKSTDSLEDKTPSPTIKKSDEESSENSSDNKIKRLPRSKLSQYERKDTGDLGIEPVGIERKSRSIDTKSDRHDHSHSADEPKKLPKASLEIYEPKQPLDDIRKRRFSNDKPAQKSDSDKSLSRLGINRRDKLSTDSSDKSRNTSSDDNDFINPNETSTPKRSEDKNEDEPAATTDKGVKRLVDRYEKKPYKNPVEEPQPEEQIKSQTIKKIVSSLTTPVDEKQPKLNENKVNPSPSISNPSPVLSSAPKPTNEDDKVIKKLINKYETPSLTNSFDQLPAKADEKPTNEFQPEPIPITPSPGPSSLISDNLRYPEDRDSVLYDVVDNSQTDKGIRRLMDIYDKKPSTPDSISAAPDSNSFYPSSQSELFLSRNSTDSGIGKIGKSIFENYEKKPALYSFEGISVPNYDNKEPISRITSSIIESNTPETVEPLATNNQLIEEPVKKKPEVDGYKKLDLDSLVEDTFNKHQNVLKDTIQVKPSLPSRPNIIHSSSEKQFEPMYHTEDPLSTTSSKQEKANQHRTPVTKFFNHDSSMTAVVHIPSAKNVPLVPIPKKRSSKIKVFLKVNSKEPLAFDVSTSSGIEVPFKVKQKNNSSILTFGHNKVVDFNISVRRLDETNDSKLKAQLEIYVDNDYDFKIVKKDTEEIVPIKINSKPEKIYQITFEPDSAKNYTLKAALKGKNEDRASEAKPSEIAAQPSITKQYKPYIAGSNNPVGSASVQLNRSPDSTDRTFSFKTEQRRPSDPAKSPMSQQYPELENILAKTKSEIQRKLEDLKSASIKVQLEVENKNPLAFKVTNSNDGKPIEFQPYKRPNDRQIIYFNYDSIVDFTIDVRNQSPLPEEDSLSTSEETLNAEIDISVPGDYDFQIVRKDTQEPIDIYVAPKHNSTYKIKFKPKSDTSYTLKAIEKGSSTDKTLDVEKATELFKPPAPSKLCCNQSGLKSNLKQNFINPIIDQIPTDLLTSANNESNDIQINVSISNPILTEHDATKKVLNLNKLPSKSINFPHEIFQTQKSNPDSSQSSFYYK